MVNGDYRIEQVRFADGTVWSHADLVSRSLLANGGNDAFFGSYDTETLAGGAGDDVLKARDGHDTLIGGAGNDTLSGDGGNDTYQFNLGDGQDIIREYSGAGGWGGNDTLVFGAGIAPADVVVTKSGNGNHFRLSIANTGDRVVIENGVTNGDYRVDQVTFANGTVWSYADLLAKAALDPTNYGSDGADTLNGSNGNDVFDGGLGDDIFKSGPGSDQFRYRAGDGSDIIEENSGSLADVDTLNLLDINSSDVILSRIGDGTRLTMLATGQAIDVRWQFYDSNFWGLEAIVFADGVSWDRAAIQSKSWIRGGAAADTLYGSNLNDTFHAGAGADLIKSGAGSDVYVYQSGDGNDVIEENSGSLTEFDTLKLTNLNAADVMLTRIGDGTRLTVLATGDFVDVKWQFYDSNFWGLESILFADGTSWDRSAIQSKSWIRGTAGADTLYGSNGNDTFAAGSGADMIKSGAGSDMFIYELGDGNDVIEENSGSTTDIDVLKLVDLDPAAISLSRVGDGSRLTVAATGETIDLKWQFYDSQHWGIDRILFADGTLWDRARIDLESNSPQGQGLSQAFDNGLHSDASGRTGAYEPVTYLDDGYSAAVF